MLHLAALEQVFGDDLIHVLHLDPAIKGAFRVNNYHGASLAEAKATRADDFDFLFQAFFLQLLLKAFHQLLGTGGRAARTPADQDMCAI